MSGETEPVWVRQVPEKPVGGGDPINVSSQPNGTTASNPVNSGNGSVPVANGSHSPQFTNHTSPPVRVSESPLSSSQIAAIPFHHGHHSERPSSGSSVSSTSSSHSQVSLSRSNSGSNSGSSNSSTPTKKQPVHQNLTNVSVISTDSPTGPATSYPSTIDNYPRPDMIPESRHPDTHTNHQMSTSTPKQEVPLHLPNSGGSDLAAVPSIGHPAFRIGLDDAVYSNLTDVTACNGQAPGCSRLPDLLSNGSNVLNSSASDESTELVDLRGAPKRHPFRHSYSDGVSNQVPTRKRSVSNVVMAEAKNQAFMRLQHELTNAQTELKLKDEECEKLSKVRIQMERELEDLTASLFEEANKMVQDAHIKRMHTEKLLSESNQQIEVLQAEVVALKQLVLTSTPNSPNKHLHPQIDVQKKEKNLSMKPFWKTHRRSTSHHEFTKEARQAEEEQQQQTKIKCKEIDTVCLEEFQRWREKPELDHANMFFSRIFNEDIKPCLNFQNRKLASRLHDCVERNCLTIEPIPGDNSYPRKCSLTESNKLCNYKIRLNEDQEWYSISQLCRNRIAAVCDCYTYIRYIQQGLVKCEDKEAFYEISRLRRQMALARLGFT